MTFLKHGVISWCEQRHRIASPLDADERLKLHYKNITNIMMLV